MPKVPARKLILCELLRLNFKRKNNIKMKRLWVWQFFMERHPKGEFHVLVKELFDHEFFFKHIATGHFDFSQQCLTVFALFNNLLHSAISLADNANLFRFGAEYFSTLKPKKNFQYKEKKLLRF